MRIAIVDDEKRWREIAEEQIRAYPWKEQLYIDCFSGGEEFLGAGDYDIVFMDVEMDGVGGFETARQMRERNDDAILIFLTSHTEMGRFGYEVEAFRYIDKLCMEAEIPKALTAAIVRQERNHLVSFHAIGLGEMNVAVKDIIYIDMDKRNVTIHARDRNYTSNITLDKLETELKALGFFRTHKSCLVNLEYVRDFDKTNIYLKSQDTIWLSRSNYTAFRDRYLEVKIKRANA